MPEKPETFFEPGKPSHCVFSPDLDCDVYQPFSLFAPADFLCKIEPLTVGVILPSPEGDAGKIWDEIYECIASVWQSRQVGFSCHRCGPTAWALPRPCDACAMTREAQVVILEIDRGNPRAETFRDMANASSLTLQMIKAANAPGSVPGKLLILISCGPMNLPLHVQRAFHCIEYAGENGEPDLQRLKQEMEAIAHNAGGLFQEEALLSLDLSDFEGEKTLSPPAVAPLQEPSLEDLVRIVPDAETGAPAPKTRDTLAEARNLLQKKAYVDAIRELQSAGDLDPVDRATWRDIMSECLVHLSTQEVVDAFYGAARDHGRLSLSGWSANGGFSYASLRVDDTSLSRQISASEIPLYVFDQLDMKAVEDISRTQVESSAGPRIAIVVARKCEEAVGRRLVEANLSTPPLRLIEIRLAELEEHLLAQTTAIDHLKERTRTIYRREADPFLEGIHRIVCGEGEFFGRADLLSTLARHVRARESFAVYGLPRAGKSSLLRQMMHLANGSGDLAVLVDLQARPPRQLSELYHHVAQAARQALPDPDLNGLGPLFSLEPTAPASRFRSSFVDDLGELASRLHTERILLLFDEIDLILPDKATRSPRIDGYRDFLEQLRLLTEQGPFVLGIGGFCAALKQEMSEGDCPLDGRIHEHPLGSLTNEEGGRLIRDLGRRKYTYYSDDALATLLPASGWDPLLTKYLSSAALEACGTGSSLVNAENVKNGIKRFLPSPNLRRKLARIYGAFSAYFPSEAHLLRQLAVAVAPNGGPIDLVSFRQSQHLTESILQNLCGYGLLTRLATDQVSIRGGLLHEWLRQENQR